LVWFAWGGGSDRSGFGGWITAGATDNLKEMFGMVGKRFNEAARKTEGIAGDVWQHRECPNSLTRLQI
jgi:hypothetical protein